LPPRRKQKNGGYNQGLVAGRTQAYFHWESKKNDFETGNLAARFNSSGRNALFVAGIAIFPYKFRWIFLSVCMECRNFHVHLRLEKKIQEKEVFTTSSDKEML
jgi:hypothetical protein